MASRRSNQLSNLKRYGLTQADYEDLLELQGWVCAICEEFEDKVREDGTEQNLSVDHCHRLEAETGRIWVRGLLCHRCNTALGLFKDSPELLRKAIEYLGKKP